MFARCVHVRTVLGSALHVPMRMQVRAVRGKLRTGVPERPQGPGGDPCQGLSVLVSEPTAERNTAA